MSNFKDYMMVQKAADFLGVTVMTLYRWDAAGKLSPRRHPINGYRLYKKSELERLLKTAAKKKQKTTWRCLKIHTEARSYRRPMMGS
jgi:predicted site-specific integrase-resolvase